MSGQQLTIFDAMAEQKKPEAKKPGKMSQEEKIYRYMKEHGGITPLEAMEHLHCMRLGARIFDMREKGIMIENDPVPGTNYARYRLVE